MMSWFLRGLVCLVLTLIIATRALTLQAGGGPIEVKLSSVTGTVNHLVYFDVYFHPTKPDEVLAQTMYLYLVDPKDGRSCKLYVNRTNELGKVSGECTSNVIGDLKFYIHWMEGGRSSEDITIAFVAAPPPQPSPTGVTKTVKTTTPVIPSPSPTTPSPSIVASPQSSLVATPIPTPVPSPTPLPSPQPSVITKIVNQCNDQKWLLITLAGFIAGLGIPIILYQIFPHH